MACFEKIVGVFENIPKKSLACFEKIVGKPKNRWKTPKIVGNPKNRWKKQKIVEKTKNRELYNKVNIMYFRQRHEPRLTKLFELFSHILQSNLSRNGERNVDFWLLLHASLEVKIYGLLLPSLVKTSKFGENIVTGKYRWTFNSNEKNVRIDDYPNVYG